MIELFLRRNIKESIISKIDPFLKLLFILIYSVIILITDNFLLYLILFIYLFPIILLSKIRLASLFKSLIPFYILFLMTFLLHFLFTPGKVIFVFYFIKPTFEGLKNGFLFSTRLFLLIIAAALFNLTTNPFVLSERLSSIFNFLRLRKLADFPFMIALSMRYVPVIFYEGRRIIFSQIARGIRKGYFLRIISLLFPIVFSTLRKADILSYALNAKAYTPGSGMVTNYKRETLLGDILFSIYLLLLIFIYIIL